MIRRFASVLLLSLLAAAVGCRACDSCYEEGPMVDGGGCTNCGPTVRSGSAFAAPTGAPSYSPAPQPAPPMTPVR